jgi:hypothetical protein
VSLDAARAYDSGAMSVWRRKAIEAFPELRRELNDRHEIPTVYALWRELLSMWRDAHTSANGDKLDRIYRYADWCFQQRAEDLWNSTAVSFYEHILDHGSWETVLPRLSDATIRDMWGLWEVMSDADMTAVGKLLEEQKRPVPSPGSGLVHPSPIRGAESHPGTLDGARRSRAAHRSPRRGTRPRRDQRP